LQNDFVKIWKNIQKFDRSKETFFNWILNIAKNKAIDKYRKLKKEGKAEIQIIESGVGLSNEQATNRMCLREEVKKTEPRASIDASLYLLPRLYSIGSS
jgi:DNA-directed RNA polymerase specialized sigma24 family protein